MTTPSIRFRVDFGDDAAIGPGKIALLEAVARSGSLSQAARDLNMSYRRGWLLLDSLNHSFRQPVAALSHGGKGGGGAVLTAFGARLVAAYRALEADCLSRARARFALIARDALPAPRSKVPRRPLQRKAAAR